jgi:hypothetical protein
MIDLKVLHFLGIPVVVLLTKIDLACPQTRENLMHVFHSQRIQNNVRMISTKLQGLAKNKIFPIKNYEWETDLNTHVNSLSLLALRQMLRFAQDHIEAKADQFCVTGILRKRPSLRELSFAIALIIVILLIIYFFFDKISELFTSGEEEHTEEEEYY